MNNYSAGLWFVNRKHSANNLKNAIKSGEGLLLAHWLRDQRKKKGITSQQLADRLNVSQSLVSKVENCTRRLDVIEYREYCCALGVNPADGFLLLDREKYLQGIIFRNN